jgi:hypothetical protein
MRTVQKQVQIGSDGLAGTTWGHVATALLPVVLGVKGDRLSCKRARSSSAAARVIGNAIVSEPRSRLIV